jgi:hypothetical protein
VAVVQREAKKRVSFWYLDPLNGTVFEKEVQKDLSRDKAFYPETASWMSCLSNYCSSDPTDSGPITVLSLVALAIVPNLFNTGHILNPYYHPNISQMPLLDSCHINV